MSHSIKTRAARQLESEIVVGKGIQLVITMNGTATVYEVNEFPADDGRAFELVKGGKKPASYTVFIARNGQDDSCECWDSIRNASYSGPCKHVSEMRKQLEAGNLDRPEAGFPETDGFLCPECGYGELIVWKDELTGEPCSHCLDCGDCHDVEELEV